MWAFWSMTDSFDTYSNICWMSKGIWRIAEKAFESVRSALTLSANSKACTDILTQKCMETMPSHGQAPFLILSRHAGLRSGMIPAWGEWLLASNKGAQASRGKRQVFFLGHGTFQFHHPTNCGLFLMELVNHKNKYHHHHHLCTGGSRWEPWLG
jgi:hypothetical protein